MTILTAPTLLGPYTIEQAWYHPLGMNAGDFDIAVDERRARAYYYFEHVHSELVCADLTDDYTDVTGTFTTHFPHPHPPYVREAPALLRAQRRALPDHVGHYGYFPNPSEVAVAPDFHGPWTVLGDPHPLDPSRTSFRSQISCVFEHPEVPDLYVAMADRWLPGVPRTSRTSPRLSRLYGGEPLESTWVDDPRR